MVEVGVLPSWLSDFLAATSLLQAAIGFGAVVGAYFLLRRGWRAVRKVAMGIVSLATMIEAVQGLTSFIHRTDSTLAEQDGKIAGIYHETHNNDGSSVKDSADRTELAASRIELGVKALNDRMDDADERSAETRQSVELLRAEISHTTNPKE